MLETKRVQFFLTHSVYLYFMSVVQALDSTVTVGVDVYDNRCDRVSYGSLTHSRHNGEVCAV